MSWMTAEELENYEPPQSYKLLGYCTKCGTMVSEGDKESPRIVICSGCNKRCGTNKLRSKPKYRDEKMKEKEEKGA